MEILTVENIQGPNSTLSLIPLAIPRNLHTKLFNVTCLYTHTQSRTATVRVQQNFTLYILNRKYPKLAREPQCEIGTHNIISQEGDKSLKLNYQYIKFIKFGTNNNTLLSVFKCKNEAHLCVVLTKSSHSHTTLHFFVPFSSLSTPTSFILKVHTCTSEFRMLMCSWCWCADAAFSTLIPFYLPVTHCCYSCSLAPLDH